MPKSKKKVSKKSNFGKFSRWLSSSRSPFNKFNSTPRRPIFNLTYDGPEDPAIAAAIEADNKELEIRIMNSPNYSTPLTPDRVGCPLFWKELIADERMVQLRELKHEVAVLQNELKTAVKYLDYNKLKNKKIVQYFPKHGYYCGLITGWRKPYFQVKYEDEDEAELNAMEAVTMLVD